MTQAPRDSAPFDRLLARLARDGEAHVGYERLRQRLIRFFRLHRPVEADDLADLALDRIAQRLQDGVDIEHVPAYALGVARLLLKEAQTREAKQHRAEHDPAWSQFPDPEETRAIEAAVATLETCLQGLGDPGRELILAYYGADGADRIALRKRLAGQADVSLNALRNRALRLREALERCLREHGQPDPA